MFIHHVTRLNDSDLVKQVWKQKYQKDWPGPAKEAKEICKEFSVGDVNTTIFSKAEWRRVFLEACKEDMLGNTKEEHLMLEGVEAKPYMTEKLLSTLESYLEYVHQ